MAWFEMDAQLDHRLLDELAALRARGMAHLATVHEHLRANHLWTTLDLRDRFDAMHYAAELGCGKPDPRFFSRIAEHAGFAASDMLLLDDKPSDVEAARLAAGAARCGAVASGCRPCWAA